MKRRGELTGDQPLIKKSKKAITLEVYLHNLAWVLNKDASSCTAICLVNNKLLIAANEIHEGTQVNNNQTVTFQSKVIKYISNLIDFNNKKENGENVRNELIKWILSGKMRSLFKGEVLTAFNDQERVKLVESFIKCQMLTVNELIEESRIKHSKEQISTIFACGQKIVRRLHKIELFLEENPNSDLHSALTNIPVLRVIKLADYGTATLADREWIMSSDTNGYALLATNLKGTHAELKIIDYLLAARLLTLKPEIPGYEPFMIGISFKCCGNCGEVINAINECCKREAIKSIKQHGLLFKDWHKTLPVFLLSPAKNEKDQLADQYRMGLYFCEHYKSIGFIYDVKSQDIQAILSPEVFDEISSDDQSIQIYLYRDRELLQAIRKHKFSPFVKIEESEERRPMSHSSESDSDLSREEESDSSIQNISSIPTELIFEEALIRLMRLKKFPGATQVIEQMKEINEWAKAAMKEEALLSNLACLKELESAPKKLPGIEITSIKGEMVEVDVPHDGSCLFYAVAFAVLLPLLNGKEKFNRMCAIMFGEKDASVKEEVYQTLSTYDGSLEFIESHYRGSQLEALIDIDFRENLVKFMEDHSQEYAYLYHEDEPFDERMKKIKQSKTWADEMEIKAISDFLGIIIDVYQYNAENKLRPVQSDPLRPKGIEPTENTPVINLVFTKASNEETAINIHYHYVIEERFIPKLSFNSKSYEEFFEGRRKENIEREITTTGFSPRLFQSSSPAFKQPHELEINEMTNSQLSELIKELKKELNSTTSKIDSLEMETKGKEKESQETSSLQYLCLYLESVEATLQKLLEEQQRRGDYPNNALKFE